jgi:hypothetical protein
MLSHTTMEFKRLIEARVEEVRAKRRLEAERREAVAMSPNTRSAFKKKELAMIDPELIALTPNIKVEEGDENPTMQQAISKQTTLAEQPLKLVPKPATAPKYAGLKASKKRKVNGTPLN